MDIDTLKIISELAGNITLSGVLLFLLHLERQRGKELQQQERQRGDVAWEAIKEDWGRQREREISRQDTRNGQGI